MVGWDVTATRAPVVLIYGQHIVETKNKGTIENVQFSASSLSFVNEVQCLHKVKELFFFLATFLHSFGELFTYLVQC